MWGTNNHRKQRCRALVTSPSCARQNTGKTKYKKHGAHFFSFLHSFNPSIHPSHPSLFPSFHLAIKHLMTISQTQPTKDLAAARAKASFPVHELTRYIHGSDAKIARRREIASIISSDPIFSSSRYRACPSLTENIDWMDHVSCCFCYLCTHFFFWVSSLDRSSTELV